MDPELLTELQQSSGLSTEQIEARMDWLEYLISVMNEDQEA